MGIRWNQRGRDGRRQKKSPVRATGLRGYEHHVVTVLASGRNDKSAGRLREVRLVGRLGLSRSPNEIMVAIFNRPTICAGMNGGPRTMPREPALCAAAARSAIPRR